MLEETEGVLRVTRGQLWCIILQEDLFLLVAVYASMDGEGKRKSVPQSYPDQLRFDDDVRSLSSLSSVLIRSLTNSIRFATSDRWFLIRSDLQQVIAGFFRVLACLLARRCGVPPSPPPLSPLPGCKRCHRTVPNCQSLLIRRYTDQ